MSSKNSHCFDIIEVRSQKNKKKSHSPLEKQNSDIKIESIYIPTRFCLNHFHKYMYEGLPLF